MLLFRGRRARQRERDRETRIQEARDAETKSREKNLSFASATDLERAVWALSASRGYYGEAAPFAHEQPPAGVGGAFAGPGLSAAAAAILGMTAFRWSHGAEPAAPSPYTTDAYTPAPLRRYATASSGHPSYSTHTTGSSHSDHTYVEQDKSRRVVNWLKTDWRGTERMFAEEPTASRVSTPPQLPAIQVHASLPLSRPEVPPPVPPKQLVPGGLDIHAPRAYTPLYESSASVLELRLPSPSGAETHSSLNVISDYMEPSPAPPQSHHLHQPNTHDTELSLPRAPPRSMTRAQTLRRLETLQTREENEKPLPTPPEGGVSALYNAVSRAVAG
ncbi:hypothetical protein K439DRAFT_633414 [Ramaria rubella]|nr:hypothetical protein K439DRAFT_633414 [Ramaria rubella]